MRASQGALAVLIPLLALLSWGAASFAQPGPTETETRDFIAALRQGGDLASQRRHVWSTISALVSGDEPRFERWRGEGALFSDGEAPDGPRGMRGFDRQAQASAGIHGAGAPVVTFTLYNDAAFEHIRRHNLFRAADLERLRGAEARAVPAFPSDAVVIKTAWWPVAAKGLTAMPVWDPDLNPPDKRGNPYIGWRRVVAVDPSGQQRSSATVAFMGQSFSRVAPIPVSAFHNVPVDAAMASRLSSDPESRRAAAVALGRPIEAGDILVLVGLNLMTHEQDDWVWAALWWHDRPTAGVFGAGRPDALRGPWTNYLMQTTFDARTPVADDGGPNITFNPWLEARFPDGGQGGGAQSNCMACHQRATWPAAPFLPVTRGTPDRAGDIAQSPDRLRTSFLWSLALHARP